VLASNLFSREAFMASIRPRKTSSGIVYHARVRIKGAPPQSSVHRTLTHAKRWAQATEAAVRERRFFPQSEALRHTVADAIDRYIEALPLRALRDERNRRRQLAWWRRELGALRLADVSSAAVAQARDKLARTAATPNTKSPKRPLRPRSPATVNRYLAAFSHVLRTAAKEWDWLAQSPMNNVEKRKEPSGRVRYLDHDELRRLLAACRDSQSATLELIVLIAVSTGMRQGEILNLCWRDVDVDSEHPHIRLEHTKNGERRVVPLVDETARRLLNRRTQSRPKASDLVFPGRRPRSALHIKKAWRNALKRAEIEDFRFHDLRHTAASHLAMQGCTSLEIADVLGHKTLQMVKRYSHLSDGHTRRSLERLGAVVFGPVQACKGLANATDNGDPVPACCPQDLQHSEAFRAASPE
jgi:integrase